MTLQEFAALKVHDKISNAMTDSEGTITEVTSDGVLIAWGSAAARPFLYTAQSTAWFHWSKIEQPPEPAVQNDPMTVGG